MTRSRTDGRTCRVAGRIGGADATGVVIPHPYPFDLRGDRFAYAAVVASPEHLDAIAATVDFSPSRVTPDVYASSIVDLVMARAYRADAVDWPAVRREVMTSIDGLPTVEMAREGLLNVVVQNLRLAGDNHSYVQLPDRPAVLREASGFGALVGGRRVLVVFPNGPADRAGVQAGDILEAVDGSPFRPALTPVDPAAVIPFDPATHPGSAADWIVRRAGVPAAMVVTVERGPYERYVPPTGRRLAGGIGYLAVPHFTTAGRQVDYAVAADRVVAAIDASPTCGWVVDLRLNDGGSYSPMITAVGPILGNGTFLGWRDRDGRLSWVSYQDGRITDDGVEVSDYHAGQPHQLKRPALPVTVLTGPMTGSAGEVAALAFVGRSDARLFGQPTAGRTTGIEGYPLFDGTILALAVNAMTDRAGATHPAGIEPDEAVTTDWSAYGTADDPVLTAGLAWLNHQPACAPEASPMPLMRRAVCSVTSPRNTTDCRHPRAPQEGGRIVRRQTKRSRVIDHPAPLRDDVASRAGCVGSPGFPDRYMRPAPRRAASIGGDDSISSIVDGSVPTHQSRCLRAYSGWAAIRPTSAAAIKPIIVTSRIVTSRSVNRSAARRSFSLMAPVPPWSHPSPAAGSPTTTNAPRAKDCTYTPARSSVWVP